MPTVQAVDDLNEPLPILGWPYARAQKLIANTSSANVSNSVNTSGITIFTVTSDAPILFEHRQNAVPVISAASHYMVANWPYDIKVIERGQNNANIYFAVQAVSVQANVYISPRG